MLTSRELLRRAGISRATLNNYIARGLLPKPVVQVVREAGRRTVRMGLFPPSVLAIIERINELKRRGDDMQDIAAALTREAPRAGAPTPRPADRAPAVPAFAGPSAPRLSLDRVDGPAYFVNPLFQLEWANAQASQLLLDDGAALAADIAERSVFALLLASRRLREADDWEALLGFHLALAKGRLPRSAVLKLGERPGSAVENLARAFDAAAPFAGAVGVRHLEVNLAPPAAPPRWCTVYCSLFREGLLFVFQARDDGGETVLDFLARRDLVIRDVLRHRPPFLTSLAAMVADLQSSVRISAELPPEEYFELINQMWAAMAPKLRAYHATHGKHAGDGLVCYFLPQPDTSYVLNALRCAHEARLEMAAISRAWQGRKNWGHDLVLNVGLAEGQEWFGTYHTALHVEFTVLGDTVNVAARVSAFAREGAVWATKTLLGKLTAAERTRIRYGVRREAADGTRVVVPETFARICNLVDLSNPKNEKLADIATLPVAEVFAIED